MDPVEEIKQMLLASATITKELRAFDSPSNLYVVLGTAIQTWCIEKGYSPQTVSLDLCNNICDIQDKLDKYLKESDDDSDEG